MQIITSSVEDHLHISVLFFLKAGIKCQYASPFMRIVAVAFVLRIKDYYYSFSRGQKRQTIGPDYGPPIG